MQRILTGRSCSAEWFTIPAPILFLAFFCLFANVALAGDALDFFNNWFVTGDYAVAGVGLKNTSGIGTINLSSVPCTSTTAIVPCTTSGAVPAYPIAAFLYWETVENTPSPAAVNGSFNGYPVVGKMLGSDSSSGCWLPGNPSQTMRVYRADVLRDLLIDPTSHLRLANGPHPVALGQGYMGNSGVLATEGASLVVVYRIAVPSKPLLVPFRSVVIYDGEFTLSRTRPMFTQRLYGFYQTSSNPAATMTHIAGNGNSSVRAALTVDSVTPPGVSLNRSFQGAQGASWDNFSFGFNLAANASGTETDVFNSDNSCVSWGAVVMSANVQDSDHDGLLDVWETKGLHRNTSGSTATFGGCQDYPHDPCENLPAMGARNGVKDVFLQLDWMHGTGDGTKGTDGLGTHSHKPSLDALTMVANAFASHSIALHFDVGNNYQGLGLSYIVPYSQSSKILAQGGSDIDESTLVCHDTATHTCDYHVPYPVLSFKFGLASVRDGNSYLNIPGHFADDRKHTHHYLLMAHALAGPFGPTGQPNDTNPKSISGIADRPGADIMITLGLWRSDVPANDQVGSVIIQAGTVMHELGHNLGLSHSGLSTAPNCMPNYPSVMSYLYQTRGLTDASGVEHIDYSSGLMSPVNENSMSSSNSLGSLRYRVRYYAPLGPTNSSDQAATVHCDGTPLGGGSQLVRLETPTIAVPDWSNGTLAAGTTFPLDVNYDGITGETFTDQPDWASLNLQQVGGRPNFGSLSLGISATDAGISATDAGISATDAGISATDAGISATDAGISATDAGISATDAGDEDQDRHQQGGCEPVNGLTAANTIDRITLNWAASTDCSVTYNIYRCAGTDCSAVPANRIYENFTPLDPHNPSFDDIVTYTGAGFTTCSTCYNTTYTYVVKNKPVSGGAESSDSTTKPNSEITGLFVVANNQNIVYGNPNPSLTNQFQVYGDVNSSLNRALVSCFYPTPTPRNIGTYPITCTGPATTSTTDGVTYNITYLTYTPGSLTISVRDITVTAAASTKTYDGTVNSAATPTITTGSLAFTDTVTWTETYDNRNFGTTHVMTPTGVVNDTNGGNNYRIQFKTISTGRIDKAPLTITASTNTKTYDGNTSAAAVPVVVGVQVLDSVTGLVETYDNPNAGPGKTLSVTAYTVNDGNSGANYTVSLFPNTIGVINRATPTVVATGNTCTYNGSPCAGSGSATGVLTPADNLTPVTLSYSGTGGTVYGPTATAPTNAGTYTVTAGYAGSTNYTPGTSTPAAITINQATPTVTATGNTCTYNGSPCAGSGSATGVLTPTDNLTPVTLSYSGTGGTVYGPTAAAPTNAGTYTVTASYAGSTNYTSGTSTPATITINQATPTVTATGATCTYNGLPCAGSGSATGVLTPTDNLTPVTLSYSGTGGTVYGPSATTPTNAGTYTVTASYAGSTNYRSGTSTPATITINQATPTVTATGATCTYNGSPCTGSSSATGVLTPTDHLTPVTLSYSGTGGTVYGPTATAPTYPGTYTLTASFAGNTNYTSGTSTPATITINQATPTVTATGNTCTYNGSPCAGGGSATGVLTPTDNLTPVTLSYSGTGGTVYGPSATAPTNPGTYTVTASFAGNTNYTSGTSTPAALTINQATPTVTATGNTCTYTGSPCAGSGSATGVLTPTDNLTPVTLSYTGTGGTVYGPSATPPTNGGTYTVTASFAGNTYYTSGSSTPAVITINQATPTVTATGNTCTYNGSPCAGSGSATGVLTPTDNLTPVTLSYTGTGGTVYGPSATAPTNRGTYTVTATFAGNASYRSGASTPAAITINQATPTVTATGNTCTYTGLPCAGSGSATGVLTPTDNLTPVTLSYSGTGATVYGPSATAPTNAGNYTVTASYAGSTNYTSGTSTPATITISPAPQAITFAELSSRTYPGADFSVSATASSGLPVTFTFSGNCTVTSDGTVVHLTGTGSCGITAHQAGGGNFFPATDVLRTFSITSSSTVLNFDDLSDQTIVTTQYASRGVTFSGAQVLAAPNYNYTAYPPFSGQNIIYDYPSYSTPGLITATFSSTVRTVSARVTGEYTVTMTAYDASNNVLGTAQTNGPNYTGAGTPNMLLTVQSTTPIAKVTFHDSGNTYTIDDFTFSSTAP